MTNMVGGSVIWNLDVDDSKLVSGMNKAQAKAKKTGTSLESVGNAAKKGFKDGADSANDFGKKLTSLAAKVTAVWASFKVVKDFVGVGIKTAAEFETLTTALTTVTGSSDAATKAMARIKQVAKDSPFFETGTLAEFTQKMAAAGQSIDEAVDSGIRFGDVAAAFGKGNMEVERMGNTLTQVIGKGRADTVDFKELVNSGWVSVRKDVSETMGISMAQFEELLASGKITYEEIEKAASKYAGSAEKQSGSLNSLWSRLKETIATTSADMLTKSGAFDAIKSGVDSLIKSIESFDPKVITDFMKFINDNGVIIGSIITSALIPAFVGWSKALFKFAINAGLAMLPLLPWIALGAAVGIAIKLILDAFGGWEGVKNAVGNAITAITGFLQGIIPFFKGVWESIKTGFNNFVTFVASIPERVATFFSQLPEKIAYWLGFALGMIVTWGINAFNYLITNVPIWISNIATFFSELPGKIWTFLVDTYNKFITWGANTLAFIASIPSKIANGLTTLGPTLKTSFTDAWNNILNEVKQWPARLMEWGSNIGNAFLDGIKNALKNLKDAFVRGLNDAKASIKGESPPKEGPLKDIDKWGFNIGDAWVDGMKKAIAGFSLPQYEIQAQLSPFGSNPQEFDGNDQSVQSGGFTQQNNIDKVVLNNDMDVDTMLRDFSFAYRTRGDLG